MTSLNKYAKLRKELLNPAIGNSHLLRKLALSLLDEVAAVTNACNGWQRKYAEADERLRDAESGFAPLTVERLIREKEDLEKRIAELETQKAELMEHVLNGHEVFALTGTLRKFDVYLPDYLRLCAIHGVDHDAIIDKLDYQSFALARVKDKDLRQDIEAGDD